MANNRMYLVCVQCWADDAVPDLSNCIAYLAKYYPSPGWYPSEDDWHKKIELFLEEHSHGSMFGQDIRLAYEGELFADGKSKQEILTKIAGALSPNKSI